MIRQFIYFYMILFNSVFLPGYADKCDLPYGCRSERVFDSRLRKNDETIMCDVNNDAFEFKFNPRKYEEITLDWFCNNSHSVIFRWTGSTGLNVLNKRFNFANVARYFAYFLYINTNFWNLKGIDVDIFDNNLLSDNSNFRSFYSIELTNSRLDFYHNKRKLNSCRDFIDSNLTQIRSIFQIQNINSHMKYFTLRNLKNNRPICPLVFANTKLEYLQLIDIVDTFYKTNILQFTNETFADLNSTIDILYMNQVRNINVDLNLLNPSVFKNIEIISVESGSLKSIDGEIFKTFKNLSTIEMDQNIFIKINHKQGIKWIKQINQGVTLDFTKSSIKQIVLFDGQNNPILKNAKIFPDQDFCLYVDYPFNQLVIIMYQLDDYDITVDTNLSCTFLWLVRSYEIYYIYTIIFEPSFLPESIRKVLESNAYRSNSSCNFEKKIEFCDKSNYQVKEIWDERDFYLLNKKAETYLKASIYPISFLGIIINLIIIISILKKENVFEYKHYSYLILISIFSIVILQIYLLSWMTECFYPYHVFCPEMRKLVGMQFFKIIIEECLVSTLRFMCSFTYIAFTLNRIGLIEKFHGKMVIFLSKLSIKKFIAVAFFISCIFSWIKGFKYQVNYFENSDENFPILNDINAMNGEENSFQDFYFIFTLICDLINYFVLFMICLEFDLALVLKTHQRVLEKAVECLNPGTEDQNGMMECETDSKKSIAILVLNILIGVFFKLPSLFIPLINVIARFYYKKSIHSHPDFGDFYSMLFDSGFYFIIQDICELLFVISLPLQVIIYYTLMSKNLPKIHIEITDKEN